MYTSGATVLRYKNPISECLNLALFSPLKISEKELWVTSRFHQISVFFFLIKWHLQVFIIQLIIIVVVIVIIIPKKLSLSYLPRTLLSICMY